MFFGTIFGGVPFSSGVLSTILSCTVTALDTSENNYHGEKYCNFT